MIRAGIVYFVILFCIGFVLVAAHFRLLQPNPESLATALLGAAATLLVASFAAPRSAVDRLGMGGLALVPFALLEILHALRGGSGPADRLVRSLTTPEGFLGLLALWPMPLLRRDAG